MKQQTQDSRRNFLRYSAAGTAGLMIVNSKTAFSAAANSMIEFGIIGSGGRGNFVARKFLDNAPNDIKVVAAQDPFRDRLDVMADRYDISRNRLYEGIDSYGELIDSKVDAVAITSPPYFHPDQVDAAVNANKHVWMAKPVAVDTVGCLRIKEKANQVKGKLNFLVDFQTRNSPNFIEAVKRVHQGDIGDLVLGHIYYHAGRLDAKHTPTMSEDEKRLRNWVFDIELSGDIIVEQNVHVLDVANWYAKTHPVKAKGTGGRKARTDVGNCWDHFVVTFWYPSGLIVDFSSAQFTKGYDDLCMRVYGSKGTADCHYNGPVRITGDNPWKGVDLDDTWNSGVNNNVTAFVKAIRSGNYINHGDESVQSTLTGVLGRMAAYTGREVTWEEMIADKHETKVNLKL